MCRSWDQWLGRASSDNQLVSCIPATASVGMTDGQYCTGPLTLHTRRWWLPPTFHPYEALYICLWWLQC